MKAKGSCSAEAQEHQQNAHLDSSVPYVHDLHGGEMDSQMNRAAFLPMKISNRTVNSRQSFRSPGSPPWGWDKSMTVYTFVREGWKQRKTSHLEERLQKKHKVTPSLTVESIRHQGRKSTLK